MPTNSGSHHPPAIEMRRFSFRYPESDSWALENISLRIQPGEFVAVIGPNGSGKSSFCKCLNGVIPHFEGGVVKGSVRMHGQDTRTHQVAELARQVGLVLEDPDAQLFAGTVLDEAAFGPENLGMEPSRIRRSVARALRAVGLVDVDERSPSSLSGGQKQRLAIAASLAMTPSVLVFDEATSQLDAEGSQRLMELICRLKLRYKLTVIVATHDMGVVSVYADRVLALDSGRVVAFDTPERVPHVFPKEPARRASPVNRSPVTAMEAPPTGRVPLIDQPPILGISSLRCEYPGVVAVDDVTTTITPGQFVGIVGRNGSGKTTLFKAIVGLIEPAGGEVRLGGDPVLRLSATELARRVGYVQQNPDHQLFADSVWKEVAYGPTNLGLGRDLIAERVNTSLDIVGLRDRSREHPLALGRDERSLVALASILALESGIVLLDEPTRGHDLAGSRRVMEIACALRDAGRTVVAIGHDLGMLCRYVDRLIVMERGRIIIDGETTEVMAGTSDTLETAGVLASHRSPYETVLSGSSRPAARGDADVDDLYDEAKICG